MHLLIIIFPVYFWTYISRATEDQSSALRRTGHGSLERIITDKDELQETEGIIRIRSTGLGYILQ